MRRLSFRLAFLPVALMLLGATPASADQVPARNADAFVDSIGVNTHTYYTNTIYYKRYAEWKAKLAELGVRHIRENLVPDRPDQYQRLNELGAAGVRSTLIMGDPTEGISGLEELVAIARDRVRGSLEALEGSNEFDLSGRARWRDELAAYHQRLHELVSSDPSLSSLPLIGPSIVGWSAKGALGDLSDQLDYGNIHSYPDGYAPESNLSSHLNDASKNSGSRPVMATETGYHTAVGWTRDHKPASEEAQATYVPRMFLEYFRRGVARTFSYELLDEGAGATDREDSFGLLRHDLSEKPAFVALRNTIEILEDPGAPFAAGALEYSLAGAPSDLRQMLLQKRDGSFYLALWRAAAVWDPVKRVALSPSSTQVSVRVDSALAAAERYAPNSSATPVGSYADPNQTLSVSVGPQVTILRLTPADGELAEILPASTQTPTTPVETPQAPPQTPQAPPAPAQTPHHTGRSAAGTGAAVPAPVQARPSSAADRRRGTRRARRTARRARSKSAKRSRRLMRTRAARASKRSLKRRLQRH